MKLKQPEKSLKQASLQSGMDEQTARQSVRLGRLPSEVKAAHRWRTRSDPFAGVWEEVRARLAEHPGLEAKTLLADLQRR